MTDIGKRIAVIGTGISGLGAAFALNGRHRLTVYEKDDRLGGHAHTRSIDYDGTRIEVDTGFIVYNEVNYPNLTRLFETLDIATDESNMSFAVSSGDGRLEWAGESLRTVFAQKRNLARPRFIGMLRDILRFNREAMADLRAGRLAGLSLGDYLSRRGFGEAFHLEYLLPMGAAIWSTPAADMMAFPAESFIRFFANHALLRGLDERHQWRTVRGGSRRYVEAIGALLGDAVRLSCAATRVERDAFGVTVHDARGNRERYDGVVLATHADQALRLLARPTDEEAAVLGAFRYTENRAVLHRDPAQMPRRRAVWSSWNYMTGEGHGGDKVALTYWMNRLQGIDPARPLFVSLNPYRRVRDELTFATVDYRHPMFDRAALEAQRALPGLQGRDRVWFAGAYAANGFHEDGLVAGLAVATDLGCPPVWLRDRVAAE